jgi:hypothetical protein
MSRCHVVAGSLLDYYHVFITPADYMTSPTYYIYLSLRTINFTLSAICNRLTYSQTDVRGQKLLNTGWK